MRSRFICEVRHLLECKRWLVFFVTVSVLAGILTLFSCDGIFIVWRFVMCPPFTLPLLLLLALDILLCGIFGVMLACLAVGGNVGDSLIWCVVSYILILFWCPLSLLARAYILSVADLAAASVCFIRSQRCCNGFKYIRATILAVGLLIIAYFAYISLGLALRA